MATTQTIQTSSLPKAFETFYTKGSGKTQGLIPQAFSLYGKGTPADYNKIYMDPLKAAGLYSGEQRVAPLSAAQQQLGQEIMGMETPMQFGAATGALGYGLDAATGLPSLMDPSMVQQYMSPYVQNVLDIQKQEALRDAQRTNLAKNLGAARQGSYGGSRQLMSQLVRERDLGEQMAKIQATGLQSAFENAQKGLEAERASRLQQAQTYGTLGQQLGQLGVAQQAADLDRLKTLGAYGDLERATSQQIRDIDYQNLMNRIQFPESQLEKLSSFIRGIPTDKTETTITPPPSFASQLTGLGLSGLGLYNMLNPKG